ncbi:site-specific integrase, partial [Mesorhizobium japonicum]|uniref:site-specific integrase n=1 Tax=Mesorhizobium japonicum TaxID=2066070 RepID=UPI003B5925E4
RGRSPHTVAAYRRDLTAFLATLAGRGVETPDAVTPELVADHVAGLRGGSEPQAASSVARALSSIRGFTRFLVEEGLA